MKTKNKIILIVLSILVVSMVALIIYAATQTTNQPDSTTSENNQSTPSSNGPQATPDKQTDEKTKPAPSDKSNQSKTNKPKPATNNPKNSSKSKPGATTSPSKPSKKPTKPPSKTPSPGTCNLPDGVPCSLKLNTAKSDEFNGSSINTKKWANGDLWDSGSTGRYLPEQCKLSGGLLYAEAYRQSANFWPSCQISSAFSYSTHSFLVSPPTYVEFRGKLPAKGAGLHSAFWLIYDPKTNPAPYQEIDVMESIGNYPKVAYISWHEDAGGSAGMSQAFGLNNDGTVHLGYNGTVDLSKSLHTYGVYFTKNTLTYYIDKQPIVSLDKNTPNFASQDLGTFSVVIDLITDSSWAGQQDASTPNPSKLVVDYVRTYE